MRGGRIVGDARPDERGDLEALERAPGLPGSRLEALHGGRHRLGRNPVEDDTVGDLTRELEHLRPECSEHDAYRPRRRRRGHPEILHAVERALEGHALARGYAPDDLDRLADLLERIREGEAVPVADDDAAAQPEPQEDAVVRAVVQARRREAQDHGRPRLDGHDRGADLEALRGQGDERHQRDRIVAGGLADPGGVITARLGFARDGDEVRRRLRGERGEDDADPRRRHASVLTASRAALAAETRNRWSFTMPTRLHPSRMRRLTVSGRRQWIPAAIP